MLLKEQFELSPIKGAVLVSDLENPFIIPEPDEQVIERPNGAAYEEANEGSGTIIKLAETIRYGQITAIGETDAEASGFEVGTYVFYHAHSATLLPIGPQATVVRIPLASLLAQVSVKG